MSNDTPPPITRFLRLKSILAPVGPIPVGKSTWWAGVRSGRFPKPHKLGSRITVWTEVDIRTLADVLAGRRQAQSNTRENVWWNRQSPNSTRSSRSPISSRFRREPFGAGSKPSCSLHIGSTGSCGSRMRISKLFWRPGGTPNQCPLRSTRV